VEKESVGLSNLFERGVRMCMNLDRKERSLGRGAELD